MKFISEEELVKEMQKAKKPLVRKSLSWSFVCIGIIYFLTRIYFDIIEGWIL